MINIAILGHGVVGSGVIEVILSHKESLTKRSKEEINVKKILDIREFNDVEYKNLFTKNYDEILNDPEISIVVEVMGGLEPAFTFVKSALEKGKSVVTSNKELVAAKGAELLAIAQKNNLSFMFEASVGGGIPIIRPISQCLAANEVGEIAGILNGTTNFILTKMIKEKLNFDDALKLAQELGYAERNPAADVEGHDACRKICILASLAFGTHVYPDSVHTEGITNISLSDVDYAANWGGVIKLIGSVKMKENGKISIIVSPMFVGGDSQLANVDDVFNGIMVRGDATGDVVFYGKGAGKLPTASAVVADVIDCIKHAKSRKYLFWDDAKENYVEDYKDQEWEFYLRGISENENPDMVIENIFGKVKKLVRQSPEDKEIAFTTKTLTESDMIAKIKELEEKGINTVNMIRISDY